MIRINLLPVRQIRQRAAARQQLSVFGIAMAGLLAVLLVAVMILSSRVGGLKNDVAGLEREKEDLAKILAEIEELGTKKALIDKQTEIVERLKKTSSLTAYVLNEVANITPNERMWLTVLDQSAGTMKLTGMALDNQTVAEYLQALEKSDFMSSVVLTSSSLAKYAGRNLKTFVLSSVVGMPGVEPLPAEEEGTESGGKKAAKKAAPKKTEPKKTEPKK